MVFLDEAELVPAERRAVFEEILADADRLLEIADQPEAQATETLTVVRDFARRRRAEMQAAINTLRDFLPALAALEGRKAALYVSRGFDQRPREPGLAKPFSLTLKAFTRRRWRRSGRSESPAATAPGWPSKRPPSVTRSLSRRSTGR